MADQLPIHAEIMKDLHKSRRRQHEDQDDAVSDSESFESYGERFTELLAIFVPQEGCTVVPITTNDHHCDGLQPLFIMPTAASSLMPTPAADDAEPPHFGEARVRGRSPQPFNLLITTCHPESTDESAGEVARVPAEFDGRTVLIDLGEVTRIDSWGIALFIEAMQRITARGGNLVLIGIHDDVRRVLETAKLDQVFHICSSREEALAESGRLIATM